MAISGTLKIDGGRKVGYNVLECDYEFSQQDESTTHKPATDVRGGKINFTIHSLDKMQEGFFYSWMFSKDEVRNGEFSFPIWTTPGDTSELGEKVLRFEDAFCIKLYERFSNQYLDNTETPTAMTMNITLSATKILFTNEKFTNNELDY